MIKKLAFLIIILIFAGAEGMAQKYDFKSSEPQTVLKEVKRDNGQLYTVIITLPSDYNPEKEYKILYYLDAWWLKELVSGCYRIKSLSNKSLTNKMDELILVGVSSTGNEEDWNKQRNMDFTPSPYNQNLVFSWGSEQLSAETTGGAKEFLSFFEHDIINSIESEYKIDPASRGILGHSFGGLFGFYSYLTHSELFSNYILIAPSVWWNTSELLTDKESLISKRTINMFIAMGTNEIKLMKAPLAVLIQELERESNSNMNMLYNEYENEDHHSVLPQSIYDALEFLYTKSN